MATSVFGSNNGHAAVKAFCYKPAPWASVNPATFPEAIWFQFYQPAILAKIGFSSRQTTTNDLYQSPVKFDILASNDCKANQLDGIVLMSLDNIFWTKSDEAKAWVIPEEKRRRFRCYGVKVYRTKTSNVVITNTLMWEERVWY